MTRVALDTNILAYAEGVHSVLADAVKIDTARHLFRRLVLGDDRPVIPVQVLAELHRVLLRKGKVARHEVAARLARFRDVGEPMATTRETLDQAITLAEDHGLQIFDAVIMAAAVEARCDLLLSEELQDGFSWRGVTVCNPFAEAPDPRVARLLPRAVLAPKPRRAGRS